MTGQLKNAIEQF